MEVVASRSGALWGGARGTQFSVRRITGGYRKVPTMSQVLSLIQHICIGNTLSSNIGGRQSCSCSGRHLTSLRRMVYVEVQTSLNVFGAILILIAAYYCITVEPGA